MGKKLNLSENDWLRIGEETGWLKEAKMYNRICAWCQAKLGEPLQDNVEPKNEWGADTHGLCPKCEEQFLADYRARKQRQSA